MKILSLILVFFLINLNNLYGQNAPDTFADIIDPLLPSVVSIASTTIVEERQQQIPQFPEGSPFNEFFKEYFDDQQRNGQSSRPLIGLGSGFIIDSNGIIVTNNHVIEGADEITIILDNGNEFKAEVIGTDSKTDIAVIKIDPGENNLKALKWGDSEKSRVGDWAIAIGNPLGLGGTVTTGVISAIARDIGGGPYVKFIQTDASINRGNSGGPLFNLEGEVIGINSAIISQTGGSIGLGFAIPANSAKLIIKQLIKYGEAKRGWLGVQIQSVTEEIAESLGLDSKDGAFIASVQDNSPAKKAGLEAGDVIIKFNDTKVLTYRDLPRLVAETEVGSTVNVEVWKKNKIEKYSVKIGELDEGKIKKTEKLTKSSEIEITDFGISVRELNEDDFLNYQLSEDTKGIIVSAIKDENIDLSIGDIIIEINREAINDVNDFLNNIKEIKESGRSSVLIRIIRDQKVIWSTLRFLK